MVKGKRKKVQNESERGPHQNEKKGDASSHYGKYSSQNQKVVEINKEMSLLASRRQLKDALELFDGLAKVKYPIYLCDIYSHKARNSYY